MHVVYGISILANQNAGVEGYTVGFEMKKISLCLSFFFNTLQNKVTVIICLCVPVVIIIKQISACKTLIYIGCISYLRTEKSWNRKE